MLVVRIDSGKDRNLLGYCNQRVSREAPEALVWVVLENDSPLYVYYTATKCKQKF